MERFRFSIDDTVQLQLDWGVELIRFKRAGGVLSYGKGPYP